jgi:hypothetical protein
MNQKIEDKIKFQLQKIQSICKGIEATETQSREYLTAIGCTEVEFHVVGTMAIAIAFSIDDMKLEDVVTYSWFLAHKHGTEGNAPKEEAGTKDPFFEVEALTRALCERDILISRTAYEAGMPIAEIIADLREKMKKADSMVGLAEMLCKLQKVMSRD